MTRYLAVAAALALAACNRQPAPRASNASYPASADRSAPPPSAPMSGPVLSYADVVDRASPAVVTIRSARRVRTPQQFPFSDDPLFRRFFGDRAPSSSRGPSTTERALGSGVIVTADGHVLTNHHVVDGAEEITVELPNRQTYSAKLLGSDAPSDLAVLQIGASGLPTLSLGDSDQVRVGDVCLALGNPMGIGETVTAGIVSAKGRSTGLSDGAFQDFLQTDAAINQGNSGGALINTRAELIGINSQILTPTGGNIGIGFAIPANMAKVVMAQLEKGGKVRRGMLGVSIQPVTSDIAASMKLKEVRGALVGGVTPGSPADRAGLKTGDVIIALNGQPINDPNDLRNRIASTPPGTQVTLRVIREGAERDVTVTLGETTPESAAAQQRGSSGGGGQLGLDVQPLTPDEAAQLGLPRNSRGVLVRNVDPSGPAADAGLTAGDVIVEVNRQPVRSPEDLRAAAQKSGSQPVLLLVNRGGRTMFLTVKPR